MYLFDNNKKTQILQVITIFFLNEIVLNHSFSILDYLFMIYSLKIERFTFLCSISKKIPLTQTRKRYSLSNYSATTAASSTTSSAATSSAAPWFASIIASTILPTIKRTARIASSLAGIT